MSQYTFKDGIIYKETERGSVARPDRDLTTLLIERRQFGKEFAVIFTDVDNTEREVFVAYTREEAEAFVNAHVADRRKLWGKH